MTELVNSGTRAVAEALLNGLWQGLVLAGLAWLLLRAARGAAARYVVWCATLVAVFCLPLVHLGTGWYPQPAREALVTPAPAEPWTEAGPGAAAVSAPPVVRLPVEIAAGPVVTAGVILWIGASFLLLLRLALGYRRMQRIKRGARPVDGVYEKWWRRWAEATPVKRRAVFAASDELRLPITAGLTRPAILFPRRLLERLGEEEARVAWLHELAHVRRFDDWTKLGQRVVEALLFFHPAVRWIGRRLELEREIACDDWVVGKTGEARPYAACLAKLAEHAAARPESLPAPAMAADRKQIFRRVRMLINKNRNQENKESRAWGIVAVAAVLTVAVGMAVMKPVLVLAAQQEAAPAVAAVKPVPPRPPMAPAPPAPPAPVVAAPAPPAPPAPPTPAQESEPQAVPKPKPEPKLNPEKREKFDTEVKAVREEMEQHRAELRELARQMREEARRNFEPHRAELRQLTKELREKIKEDLRPQIEEMKRLQQELQRERASGKVNEEAERKFEQRMAKLQRQIEQMTEANLRGLEEQIQSVEEKFHPSEEMMRKVEEQMRVIEKQMQKKADETEKLQRHYRRDAAPEAF